MKEYLLNIRKLKNELEDELENALIEFEEVLFKKLKELFNLDFILYHIGKDEDEEDELRFYKGTEKGNNSLEVCLNYNLTSEALELEGHYGYDYNGKVKLLSEWVKNLEQTKRLFKNHYYKEY